MKVMPKLVIAILVVSLFGSGGMAFAHCGMCGMEEETAGTQMAGETNTFQATVVCLGCTLKKQQGAKAQCSIYGHQNALRTEGGKIWSILENDASAELINSHDYAGKEVEIKGKKFIDAQVIEVESVKAIEE